MQPYEHHRAQGDHRPYRQHGHIPAMRPTREIRRVPPSGSTTPIYDALCAEYRSLFRTLPGDRAGEEELQFKGFGTVRGTGTGHWDSGSWRTDAWAFQVLRRSGRTPAALPPARDGRTYEGL